MRQRLRNGVAGRMLGIVPALTAVILLGMVYKDLERRVDELLGDSRIQLLVSSIVAGIGLLAGRRLLMWFDRALPGRRIDPSRSMIEASEKIGHARTRREVALETARQLETACGASSVAVLLRRPEGDFQPVQGSAQPLHSDTAFDALLHETTVVSVAPGSPLLALLPEYEREWLMHGRFEVLARTSSPDQNVAGIIAMGARHLAVPYSGADLALMSAIAGTAGLALHRPWIDEGPEAARGTDDRLGAVECSHCGAVGLEVPCECAARVLPALLPHQLAGKFEIVRRLGQGGMGVVYLGRDVRLHRAVALKTLPQVSGGPVDAMFDEARAMAAVEHQNLALLYGLEVWRDTPVLVVEYLAGGTLADRLRRERQPVARALGIGAALADALSALHEAGILHRDIKPSNVGFTKADVPKVLDFGVARLLARADAPSAQSPLPTADVLAVESTAIAGTPLYLSPEALQGATPDPRVDLWALAVVVLEAIAGTYPFRARDPVDVVRRLRRGGKPDWSQWRALVTPEVAELFDRALSPDVEQRPQSAAAFAVQLRAVQSRLRAEGAA
jgi:hypothetical protein